MRLDRSRARRLASIGIVLLAGAVSAQQAPLFAIPTESLLSQPLAAGAPLRVALYARDPAGIAAVLGIAAPDAAAGRLEYTIASYPQLGAVPERTWLESSFVVDFLEPDVARLHDRMIAEKGAKPTRAQLIDFVSQAIAESGARGWDIASVVARKLEGDCTEHAVLTAALARSIQMKARVVLGVALVSGAHGPAAYGHAWAEVDEGGRWIVADAALSGADAQVRYVPLGVLAEEGPGFELDIVRITNLWVNRVVLMDKP